MLSRSSSNLLKTIRMAYDMPWVAGYEIRRILAYPYNRMMFGLHGIRWGKNWRIWGMPIIQRFRGSRIEIGNNVCMRSWRSSNPLVPNHPVVLATRQSDAVIQIGYNVGLTATTIVAEGLVQIGDNVAVGSNTVITDTDFHPLDFTTRLVAIDQGDHAPVVIDDEVFIGLNCLILKGVRIGKGSVIGGGSVVTGDVPPGVIVAGNPARLVRALADD